MTPEAALARRGKTLPSPNTPVGTYVMAVRTGDLLVVSGHGAFVDGRPVHRGRLGESLTTERGIDAAEAVMLNLLATVKAELGELSRVRQVVKLVVFVSSAPGFADQHVVANGATDLLVDVFGESVGRCARSAVGVAALPLGFAVEIEAMFEVVPEAVEHWAVLLKGVVIRVHPRFRRRAPSHRMDHDCRLRERGRVQLAE